MSDNITSKWIVITTINQPTKTVELISQLCESGEWNAVVVGDTRTPADWNYHGIDFLSVDMQRREFGQYAEELPYRHYARKNLGYLYAIRRGAQVILETDDDNIPYSEFGRGISRDVSGARLNGPGWINIYPHFVAPEFSSLTIWPRGLPLDAIFSSGVFSEEIETTQCAIQQYLADGDPDVDAIWRLTNKQEVCFRRNSRPVLIGRDVWVPFNSQNTVFFEDAFPLLYLPSYVSFRMTDIWRSFVAQAALGAKGMSWSFHPPTVEQKRNEHDLTRDFADEIPGYINNRRIGDVLERARDSADVNGSLADIALHLWRALADARIISADREIPLVERWFSLVSDSITS